MPSDQRPITINGRTYTSLEMVPDDLRMLYERARVLERSKQLDAAITTKITVNGKVYSTPAEMPPDVRESYERLMQLQREVTPKAPASSGIAIRGEGLSIVGEPRPDASRLQYRPSASVGTVKSEMTMNIALKDDRADAHHGLRMPSNSPGAILGARLGRALLQWMASREKGNLSPSEATRRASAKLTGAMLIVGILGVCWFIFASR